MTPKPKTDRESGIDGSQLHSGKLTSVAGAGFWAQLSSLAATCASTLIAVLSKFRSFAFAYCMVRSADSTSTRKGGP